MSANLPQHHSGQYNQSDESPQSSEVRKPDIDDVQFLKTYPLRYDSRLPKFGSARDRSRYSSSHHPEEKDYTNERVEVKYRGKCDREEIEAWLLRVYPETFNTYDAYMDIPMKYDPEIEEVSWRGKVWDVVAGPYESPIVGKFRGDHTSNNPPAWIYGLQLKPSDQNQSPES